jgi:hypothetical protein
MWKRATNIFPQEDTIIEGTIIELFEEALDFRVSLKHGGRCGTTEEQYTAPRWHEEYTKLIHATHRIARTHEGATHSTTTLNSIILSTTIQSEASQWIHHEDREGGG